MKLSIRKLLSVWAWFGAALGVLNASAVLAASAQEAVPKVDSDVVKQQQPVRAQTDTVAPPADQVTTPVEVKPKSPAIVVPEQLPSKTALGILSGALQFNTSSDETIRMSGLISLDGVDGTGRPFVYIIPPGAGAAGLLVGVLTHGLFQNSANNARQKEAQAAADKIVAPFTVITARLRKSELIDNAMTKITKELTNTAKVARSTETEAANDSFEFEYRLNQDGRTWMLDMASVLPVQTNKKAETAISRNVRVLGRQLPEGVDASQMLEDDGKLLRQELQGLLAEAMTIANSKLNPERFKNIPETTVRFTEAGRVRFERGNLIGEDCNRVVVKTLRGWILSAPRASESSDPSCALQ